MHMLKNLLRDDARYALQVVTLFSPTRAIEILQVLIEGTLLAFFWLDPRANAQIRCELINFIFLIEKKPKITESFIFWRLLRIVQNLLRDGLIIPREEIAVGTFSEDENLDDLLSKLDLHSEECPDKKERFRQKLRKPGIRHKAAQRALILALKEKRVMSGQKGCPDKKAMSEHKMRQGELFQLAA